MEGEKGILLTNEVEVDRLISCFYNEMPQGFEFSGEQHSGWEFVYVNSGNICVEADNYTYILKKGEMVCHKPFEFHTIKAYGGAASVIITCFESKSQSMEYFKKKIFAISSRQRLYFNDIAEASKSVFLPKSPLDISKDGSMTRSPDSSPYKEQFIKNTLELLIVSLMSSEITERNKRIERFEHFSQRQTLAKNIVEYLHNHIDETINLNAIADNFSYSLSSIKRIFKEETGHSIISYLNDIRMKKAKDLLRDSRASIEEISLKVGFSNVHYFSSAFKKRWNMSPSHFRLKNRNFMSEEKTSKKERVNNMCRYRMVIADDERIISNSLSGMIANECPDVEVVGIFNNGEQVIDYLKNYSADIIITDIRMPIKDGLQVAEYVKANALATKVIIITGYREFEYAKKAIEYGVHSIITKPINMPELIKAVEDIKESISDKISRIYEDNEREINLRKVYRQAFFMLVNSNPTARNTFVDEAFKGFELKEETCVVIDFCAENVKDSAAFYDTMWRDMCEIKNESIDAYCISEYNDYAKFFVITTADEAGKTLSLAESFAKETIQLMHSAYGLDVKYEINSLGKLRPDTHYNFNEIVNTYINYLLLGHNAKKDELLWIVKSSADENMLKRFIREVLSHLKTSFMPDVSEFEERLEGVSGEEELSAFIEEIEIAVRNIPSGENIIVSVVKNYITNYTGSDYTLKSVADAVSYTPYYLSRIFKSETGENLPDYILNARMERAKRLLLDKTKNIQSVAKAVGFENASYFSRSFKKHTGMTPKQYALVEEKKR